MLESAFYIKDALLVCSSWIHRISCQNALPVRIIMVDAGTPFDVLETVTGQPFLVTYTHRTQKYAIFDSLAQENEVVSGSAFCRNEKGSGFIAKRDGVYYISAGGKALVQRKVYEYKAVTFMSFNWFDQQLAIQQGREVNILDFPSKGSPIKVVQTDIPRCELFSNAEIESNEAKNMWNGYGQVLYTKQPLKLAAGSISLELDVQLERQMFGQIASLLYFCDGRRLYFFDTAQQLASCLLLYEQPQAVRVLKNYILAFYASQIAVYEFPVFVSIVKVAVSNVIRFRRGLCCEIENRAVILDTVREKTNYCDPERIPQLRSAEIAVLHDEEVLVLKPGSSSAEVPFKESSFSAIFGDEQQIYPQIAENDILYRIELYPHYIEVFDWLSGGCVAVPSDGVQSVVHLGWEQASMDFIFDIACMNIAITGALLTDKDNASQLNSNNDVVSVPQAECSLKSASQLSCGQNASQHASAKSSRVYSKNTSYISSRNASQLSSRHSSQLHSDVPAARQQTGVPLITLTNYYTSALTVSTQMTTCTEQFEISQEVVDCAAEICLRIDERNSIALAQLLATMDPALCYEVAQYYNSNNLDTLEDVIYESFPGDIADVLALRFEQPYQALSKLINKYKDTPQLIYFVLMLRSVDVTQCEDYNKGDAERSLKQVLESCSSSTKQLALYFLCAPQEGTQEAAETDIWRLVCYLTPQEYKNIAQSLDLSGVPPHIEFYHYLMTEPRLAAQFAAQFSDTTGLLKGVAALFSGREQQGQRLSFERIEDPEYRCFLETLWGGTQLGQSAQVPDQILEECLA